MLKRNLPSVTAVAGLLLLWQAVCSLGWVPRYMLPSPVEVVQAFAGELPLLLQHSVITLQEAFLGLWSLEAGVGGGLAPTKTEEALGY